MLRHLAERLQSAVRGSDVPIRLGGDEFLVLLPECKVSEVRLVLNRLHGITGDFEGHEIPLGFAAGWTDYVPGESSQALLSRADTALYANKRGTRDNRSVEETAKDLQPAGSTGLDESADYAERTLAPREFQVLQLLAQAKSNKEVAAAMGISTRTVETYRAKIMSHLNLHSISELILYAVKHRIVKQGDLS